MLRWKSMGVAIATLVIGAAAPNARAAAITDLFNTGVDGSGTTLANLSVDPHYSLISSPVGTGTAVVVDPGGFPIPPWLANTPGPGGSMWITGPGSLANPSAIGEYVYRTTFTIGAGFDPATAIITGMMTADDQVKVLLNGVEVVGLNPDEDYENFTPFSITSNFLAGSNDLDFYVYDNHSVVTGLRVELSGTVEPAAVPEPATLAMAGLGVAALALARRRKRA